jgi:hypothetical protein
MLNYVKTHTPVFFTPKGKSLASSFSVVFGVLLMLGIMLWNSSPDFNPNGFFHPVLGFELRASCLLDRHSSA